MTNPNDQNPIVARRVAPRVGVVALATLSGMFGCRDRATVEAPARLEPSPQELVAAVDEPATSPAADESPEISDLGISTTVERELLLDHITPGQAIEVATTDGVVELTGTVDNLLAKTRATRVAELVEGVRAVSNRVIVEAKQVPDPALADDVRRALLFDPVTESYEIDVDASDGVITLTGTVGSWAEQQLAAQVVASVRGVESIENDLAIRYEQHRSDAELLREIERRLATDVLVDEDQIDVRVEDGAVTLTGIVGSAAERTRAAARAWTANVTSVDSDDLEVVWTADEPNLRDRGFVLETEAELRDAIHDALRVDPRVAAAAITVAAVGTSVTLTGEVESLAAKQAAEQLARNTVGVARVVNDLTVAPGAAIADAALAETIRDRLLIDVNTDAHEIAVDVDDGVATLTGTVDTYFEKAEAADIAGRARGVEAVNNLLQVARAELGFYYDPYLYPYDPYVHSWQTYTPTTTNLDDEALEAAIESELFWSPFIDEDQVDVFVDDGEATLTGTVDSWREREVATENAYEGGALYVDNLLHVGL